MESPQGDGSADGAGGPFPDGDNHFDGHGIPHNINGYRRTALPMPGTGERDGRNGGWLRNLISCRGSCIGAFTGTASGSDQQNCQKRDSAGFL